MKKNASIRTRAAAIAIAATMGLGAIAPAAALANDGMTPEQSARAAYEANLAAELAEARREGHYEGEAVTIGDGWGQPVYAEWHRGDSGRWWATFWTYNYTKVYAAPAPAGCGWTFHCYDADGDWVQVWRAEESSTLGQVGPQGVSSHWQDGAGRWF